MALATGHGAALAFATTAAYSPQYTSIGGPGWSRGSVEISGLTTAGNKTYASGDLWDILPVSCSFLFDPSTLLATEANSIQDLLFDTTNITADETITITLANTELSTFAGTGHVTEFQIEEFANDTIMAGSLSFQWNDSPTITE